MAVIRIKMIVPSKALFNYEKFTQGVKATLRRKTEPDLRNLFLGTTGGWKNQPAFFAHHFQTPGSIGVEVYTRDNVYAIVNAGSPSHLIRPRRPGSLLRFQIGYRSATRPGSLQSRPYQRFGQRVATFQVRHPGFEARKFTEQIKEVYEPIFVEDMQKTFEGGMP